MKEDKALKKALQSKRIPEITPDFNRLLMARIEQKAHVKQVRSYWLGLLSVSFSSLLLIGLSIFLLKDQLTLVSKSMIHIQLTSANIRTIGFFFYIAALILGLLLLDTFFRNLREKKMQQK